MATSEEDEAGSREDNDDMAMDCAPSVGLAHQVWPERRGQISSV